MFNKIFFVEPEDLAELELDNDFDLNIKNVEWNIKAATNVKPLNTVIRIRGNKADTIHFVSENLDLIDEQGIELSEFENQLRIKKEFK